MERQELINKLHNLYAQKRKRAEFFAEQNKNLALQNKTYFQLELTERELILDISKLSFQQKPTKELEQKLSSVKQEKLKILNKLGFTEASLLPNYECPFCHDTGRIKNEECSCFKQALNNLFMQESQICLDNIPDLKNYETSIFQETQKEQMKKILDFSKKYITSFPNNKAQVVVFSGATGVGKTYLSKVIAKEIINLGFPTYYTTAFHLNSLMLKYHTTFHETKAMILNSVLDSDLLIIDDFGTEPILKNVTKEYLLLILNERIENHKNTIINTNLAPEHILDRYGERIFSRLMNKQTSITIKMEGIDLRLKKAV